MSLDAPFEGTAHLQRSRPKAWTVPPEGPTGPLTPNEADHLRTAGELRKGDVVVARNLGRTGPYGHRRTVTTDVTVADGLARVDFDDGSWALWSADSPVAVAR